MEIFNSTFWILLTATLVGVSCALVGTFLVLRKMSLMGDAISHAVLPGIAIAFLITASRNTFPMLIGAGLFGLLTVYLTETLHKKSRLMEDASMGTVFTSLFAVGVILITLFASQVDIDQDCVLFGEIAYVPFDLWIFGGLNMGPRPVWILGLVLSLNVIFTAMFYKELKVYCFDAAYAAAMGLPVVLVHYSLMGMVSFTTVASFESVGAILVVAFLIVPPATAYLLTHDLKKMLGYAVVIAILSAWLGYYFAYLTDSSISGGMAVVAGVFFAAAFLFSPLHGILINQNTTLDDAGTTELEGALVKKQNPFAG